jgi:tetratricopeptide (TPR) repeat protein
MLAGDGEVGGDLYDRMQAAFQGALEADRFDEALACAQEMARAAPDEPLGHLNRAFALEALNQPEEAHDAYERAVALAPDDSEALRAEADFLIRRATDDSLETAVLLSRRGREHAEEAVDAAELASMEASALNALGRSDEALRAAETALALDDDNVEAQVERGVALFERLRFQDAREVLKEAFEADAANAKAAYFLGMLEERLGNEADARRLFEAAAKLDAEAYPLALDLSSQAFDALVKTVLAKLGADEAETLSRTDFSWVDLPAQSDLEAGLPVLSPTIVGLFRPADEGRKPAILLYRRNLLRLCRTPDELRREVRDTVLHELGHMNGADDAELRDRGL